MNKSIKLLVLASTSAFILTGCMGQQATVSERVQDDIGFTSTHIVSTGQTRCVRLTQAFQVTAGSTTYTLPAGNYIAKKYNDTGYFYAAPSIIKTSNWFVASPQQGIYLNNQLTHGNLYANTGVLYRPLRGAVLPGSIFPYIRRC